MDKKSFSILCLIFFTLSFSVSATGALIPAIAKYFNQPAFAAGKLVWIYMLPYGLFALIWSPLSRKFSTKKLLLLSLFAFSFFAGVLSLSPSLNRAFIGQLGMGIFGSAFTPLSLIIIGKEIGGEKKAKSVGFIFSLSFLSSLLGLFLSGFLSWRLIYFIPSLIGFITCLLAVLYLKEFNYGGDFKISYFNTFKEKIVLRLFSIIFVSSFFYHSIQQWLGVYFSQKHNLSQLAISLILSLASLAAIFSENWGGVLSNRFGGMKVASYGFIVMSLFIFSLVFISHHSLIFFTIVLWGMGWAFTHVGLSSLITNLPDKFLRDASSLNSAIRFFSGGLGSYFGSKIISFLGFKPHFLIVGILILFLGMYSVEQRAESIVHRA